MDGSKANSHGNAPDKSPIALLLIDVINDLEFPTGEQLLEQALPMAKAVHSLVEQARHAYVPVIYVNDNFGRWRSDFHAQVEHCLHDGVRGREIADLLRPIETDYFILKPKHSGFYCTNLELLLKHLGASSLILTGITADNCVLFTANDAYMRDFKLWVPRDCVASHTQEDRKYALRQMEKVLKANTSGLDQMTSFESIHQLLLGWTQKLVT